MTSRMVGSVLTLVILLLSVVDGAAQTYTQMQWGMNKGVTPYAFGANINGTWRDLGTVSSAGVWSIPASNLTYTQAGGISGLTVQQAIAGGLVPITNFCTSTQIATDIKTCLGTAESTIGNGTLYFPRGTYKLSQGYNKAANVSWQGADRSSTVIQATTGLSTEFIVGTLSNVNISNLTIDLGGFNASAVVASVNLRGSGILLDNIGIIGFDKFGLALSAATNVTVQNSYFYRNSTANTQNQSILISCSAGVNTNITVDNNVIVNSAVNACVKKSKISNNYISNFKFGGGITIEIDPDAEDVTIVNNIITGGVGLDVNNTVALGLEVWAPRSVIIGNVVYNNEGTGIDFGGQHSIVTNNVVYDNNGYLPNTPGFCGINARYSSPSVNADNSYVGENVSYGPNQYAGICEQSASLSGIRYGVNQTVGNATTGMTILSPTSESVFSTPATFENSLTVGVAGTTVGSVAFKNATSGTITLQPTTGALGTVTATLPANTGTIAETNLAQTFTAIQTFDTTIKLKGYTVAGLSAAHPCNAGAEGSMAYVTDATAPTYNGALTGGGAVKVPVFCDGANWTSH